MVDVVSMLPLLEGWDAVKLNGSEGLKAGGEDVSLYESTEDESMWLVSARLHSNVSDVDMTLTYEPADGSETITFHLGPDALNSVGAYAQSNLPYVANYDATANEYLTEFVPVPPFPMKGRLYIMLKPGSSDATANYDVLLIKVTNDDLFLSSLRGLMGTVSAESKGAVPHEEIGPSFIRRRYEGFLP